MLTFPKSTAYHLCTAVVQVASRIWVLWGLIWQAPEATSTGSITLFEAFGLTPQLSMYTLYFAWGVTEVLRYGFFAVKVGAVRSCFA